MNIVFLLIPLGMGLMVAAVAALFWAVNSGQYDDLEDASSTVLEPEEPLGAPASAAPEVPAADKNHAFLAGPRRGRSTE
ncbi:MAG TPA: cbb3-type cytochrome oxidase assembly protein CcoS [Steroidobacteraceae bacterium]